MIGDVCHIVLEDRILTNEDGYTHLIEVYNKLTNCEQKEVFIDFSRCVNFDANLSAVLGALLDEATLCGKIIWLTPPTSTGVKRCLTRNKFLKAFKVETTSQEKENFIPYTKFEPSHSQEFKKYIDDNLIAKRNFPLHTEKAGVYIRESIFEIFANASTHGNCSNIYCCGEFNNKKIPVIEMTIVDCGQTIVSNVNNFLSSKGMDTMDSISAIRWATGNGNTTKNIPGGLGLWNLIEFIKMNSGSLQIVSGNGFIELSDGNF